MQDFKNSKPISEKLNAFDYLAALGFILTIMVLIFVATI